MGFYRSVLRPLAFRADPERVHELALALLRRGLVRARPLADPRLVQELLGASFPNPLGLAAGFDKNAIALERWGGLGFGFVEVGTVTLYAQPGNPRPRLFRLPEERGLLNRLGFNNDGARAVADRLARARPAVPYGVNLGKSRATAVEAAAGDYAESLSLLAGFGSYVAVNVSSPNTPGLRDLQDGARLAELLGAMRAVAPAKPLFVKLAPDLDFDALDEAASVALAAGATGLIATNTTLDRAGLARDPGEAGGVSGAPLRARSDEVLAHLARGWGDRLILIGAGGVFDGDDLYRKLALGAHLAQVYTGWVYGGPGMVPAALARLLVRMDQAGFRDMAELRGAAL